MKTIAITLLAASILCGQTTPAQMQSSVGGVQSAVSSAVVSAQSALSSIQTAITAASQAAANLPQPDAVAAWLKTITVGGETAYSMFGRLQSGGYTVLAVVYTCPQPAEWLPSTAYAFGTYVRDAAGNIYVLSQIALAATLQSGVAHPAWNTAVGGTTNDGPYVWTTYLQAGQLLVCSAPGNYVSATRTAALSAPAIR